MSVGHKLHKSAVSSFLVCYLSFIASFVLIKILQMLKTNLLSSVDRQPLFTLNEIFHKAIDYLKYFTSYLLSPVDNKPPFLFHFNIKAIKNAIFLGCKVAITYLYISL